MLTVKKGKALALSILVLVLACILILSAITSEKAYATEKTIRAISTFLAEKEIEYSDVRVSDRTLSVKLLSSGDNRCTLDDVKAIQAIYEAVHAQTIEGQVKNVGIEIYNTDGILIYDILENDVDNPIENLEQLVKTNSEQKGEFTANDILLKAESIVTEFPYSIQQSWITESTEISGQKLQLTLCENNNDISSLDDIKVIYENLEAYSLSTNAITQCEITVTNSSGNCVLYMAGDFLFGNCIAWVSPEAESSFIAQEGPRKNEVESIGTVSTSQN